MACLIKISISISITIGIAINIRIIIIIRICISIKIRIVNLILYPGINSSRTADLFMPIIILLRICCSIIIEWHPWRTSCSVSKFFYLPRNVYCFYLIAVCVSVRTLLWWNGNDPQTANSPFHCKFKICSFFFFFFFFFFFLNFFKFKFFFFILI